MVNDPEYRSSVLDATLDDEVLALARQAFEDPGALRDRYATMLERYWELAFAEEWARIEERTPSRSGHLSRLT